MSDKTINVLYKAHPFLESKVLVSFDLLKELKTTDKAKVQEVLTDVRVKVARVCEAIDQIYYCAGIEGWKVIETIRVIDSLFDSELTKDQRSKAVKYYQNAYDIQAYLVAIDSKAVSIDRMVVLWNKYRNFFKKVKQIKRESHTVTIGDFTYGATMNDSMPTMAEIGTVLKPDSKVQPVKIEKGIEVNLTPLTKTDAFIRLGGGFKAFDEFKNQFNREELEKIKQAAYEITVACEELLKVRKAA